MRSFIAIAVLLGAIPAAQADDEARQAIATLKADSDARLRRLEAAADARIQLQNQIEDLGSAVADLRGQIEVLGNSIQQTHKQQDDYYVDLDGRLRKLEDAAVAAQKQASDANGAAAPSASAPGSSGKSAGATDAEAGAYQAALNLLQTGKNKEAAAAFLAFNQSYPNSSYLPSSTFFAASALYAANELSPAEKLFSHVVETWPDDARAPDALLGLAYTQTALGEKRGAKASLKTLATRYPSSEAARRAASSATQGK